MTDTKKNASSEQPKVKAKAEAKTEAKTEALTGFDDLVAIGQDNVEAFAKAGSLFAEGIQDINMAWFALAQESAENAAKAVDKTLACKSLTDVLELQGKLGKSNYDKLMANSQKLSKMSQKLAEEVSQPIAERVNAASESFGKPFAA